MKSTSPSPRSSASIARLAVVMPAETEHLGGVQRFAQCLVPELEKLVDVVPISVHPSSGVQRTASSRITSQVRGLGRLRELISSAEVDAVLSTYHWPPAVSRRIPTVGYVHDLRGWGLHGDALGSSPRIRLTSRALRRTWSTWAAVAVPSDHVARDVRRVSPATAVHVVPEGLDHLEPSAHINQERGTRALVLGGRAPHKRTQLGLDVADRLHRELGIESDVIGVAECAGRPWVTTHPSPSDAELAELFHRAVVAVAPTGYEGFGLAVGEAMWFGLPVVYATDAHLGGLVADGGVAAQPTGADFVRGVREALRDRDRMGCAAAERARTCRWSDVATTLIGIVEASQDI